MSLLQAPNFRLAIQKTAEAFKSVGQWIHTGRWQGVDIKKKPEMEMREVLNWSLQVSMVSEHLEHYRAEIEPNLPWADDHFLERISGHPWNPGVTWKTWPYAVSADRFRSEAGAFSHSYAERYWPKYAGMIPGGALPAPEELQSGAVTARSGIRYGYGDLEDLVALLAREPDTRQAYLPVWNHEDTGVVPGERVPCTLGYHFIQRRGFLHVVYYIRSCDFVRHFRDDIYLTIRLTLWILRLCQARNPEAWAGVRLGAFTMHITSLHMFKNDYRILFQGEEK